MSLPQDRTWTPTMTTCGTLPAMFCLLMGLVQSCILLQEVITWPVLWELIVMGLDFTYFFWRLCCLSWPSPSQDQQLAALGKCYALISCTRGKTEEVSEQPLYALIFGTAQFFLLSVMVLDFMYWCLFKPTSKRQLNHTRFPWESHFNHNRHETLPNRWGTPSRENLFLWPMVQATGLENSDSHGNPIKI